MSRKLVVLLSLGRFSIAWLAGVSMVARMLSPNTPFQWHETLPRRFNGR